MCSGDIHLDEAIVQVQQLCAKADAKVDDLQLIVMSVSYHSPEGTVIHGTLAALAVDFVVGPDATQAVLDLKKQLERKLTLVRKEKT